MCYRLLNFLLTIFLLSSASAEGYSRPGQYQRNLSDLVKSISAKDYRDFYCVNDPSIFGAGISRACTFTINKKRTIDGIELQKDCTVALVDDELRRGQLARFYCPERFRFQGILFDKMSTFDFGTGRAHTCTHDPIVNFMGGRFYGGFCISFSKDKTVDYILPNKNVVVEGTTYFHPSRFVVSNGKVVYEQRGKVEGLAHLILCSKSGKTKLIPDVVEAKSTKYAKATITAHSLEKRNAGAEREFFDLQLCSKVRYSRDEEVFYEFELLQTKGNRLQIVLRNWSKDKSVANPPETNQTYWVEKTSDLTSAVTVTIKGVEIFSPFLDTTLSDASASDQVLYADKEYIYFNVLQRPACWSLDSVIYKIPRPAGLEINDAVPEWKKNYDSTDICEPLEPNTD